MYRRSRFASERLKMATAESVGFAAKVRSDGWENATSGEIGSMVGEMIRRGQQVLLSQQNHEPATQVRSIVDWPPEREV